MGLPAMISTRDLSGLPGIEALRRLAQSLAVLDAILCRDFNRRTYGFNASWGDGQMLATMRNVFGDSWNILFAPEGVLIVGTDSASPMSHAKRSWPGVPPPLSEALKDPVFDARHATFCIWRHVRDTAWKAGLVSRSDGSEDLLAILDGSPATFARWAEERYGVPGPLLIPIVEAVYRHEPITDALVKALSPDLRADAVEDDLAEIGYHPAPA